MNWYSRITQDIANIPPAILWYEGELEDARKQTKLFGNLEKQAANLPGIVEERFGQLQEIEAVLEYLNIELRRTRSRFFKQYLENYQRALSSRDVEKYVEQVWKTLPYNISFYAYIKRLFGVFFYDYSKKITQ